MTRAFVINGQVHAAICSARAAGGDDAWYLCRRLSPGRWQIIGPVQGADEAVRATRQSELTEAHPDVATWAETQSTLLLAPARAVWPQADIKPGHDC
jgi:hypothetical protein